MLDLTNEEKQRQLSRSVTEWEEFFAELEASWGYWFPDVKTLMKGPKDETDKTKLRQEASGTSTNATMRCTHTRKLKQSSFNRTEHNGLVEATSEKKSLTQSRRVTDEERRVVGASNPSDVIKSISDVKVLPEQSNKGSVKATSKSNRTTASSKSSNAKRILLLELEAMKKQDEIDEQLAAARRKAEIRRKQHEIDTLTEKLEIAKLEEETARAKQVLKNDMDSARNEMQLKLTQSQKVTKQLQQCKGPQECYRTFKASSTSTKPLIGTELREQSPHSRKNMNEMTNKESPQRSNKEPCFGRTDSKSIVGSHWRSNHKSVESSSMMRTVKQTQTERTSSKESSRYRNESLKRKDDVLGKQEEMVLLKTLVWTTKGKCTVKKWKPEQMKFSDKCLNHGKLQDKTIKREALEDSNMTNAESDANKETSKRLAAEWMWNRPETFVVDNGWQDFHSGTLLVDTQQVLEEETHLVMSEHLIVQTEETLDAMTETMQEHRSLTFALSKQSSEEQLVQLEMLQDGAEVITAQQDVQHGKFFQVTVFYGSTLLLEERNKCYEFVKSYDFVNEQRYTLPEELNEIVMHRKQCHVAMKHDKPAKGHAKIETQIVNATFGKKTNFDFNESLLEETILSHRNVWNHWIGNGNSGMDAVAQANVIDETQLSNGHRKQSKRRIWKIEHNWNLIQEMEEGAQLNMNGTPQDDTLWLREFRDNSSVSRMEMCSLKVPTTASWSDGSCNGPATPFMAMGTQYGSIGKLEVSDDLSEPRRNPDDNKFVFCGERSSVTLYKQQRKRNSTALQLLGENVDVATKNDVSVSKELNVVQRLSLKHKSIPIGYTENIEHKGKNSSRCNVGNSLYPLIMMMDDSIISSERQIEILSMERLENELSLTYRPCGQSTLMRKFVAEQILGNCLETFSAYLEIYSLDVEVIMEVELNVLKQFCIIPFEGSKEKQLRKLNECRTLMMKIGIIGKTITSNETTVFWKYFVLWQYVENKLFLSEQEYGLEKHCSRERTQQTTGKHDYETEVRRKTTTIDDKLKRPVVRLAPMFYESVFREKNRAGDVGASQLRDQKLKFERD